MTCLGEDFRATRDADEAATRAGQNDVGRGGDPEGEPVQCGLAIVA